VRLPGGTGVLDGDGLGLMVGGDDDDIDLETTKGCRSRGSTPAASDPDVEMEERSEAIDRQ
jgi:hypothetical protein